MHLFLASEGRPVACRVQCPFYHKAASFLSLLRPHGQLSFHSKVLFGTTVQVEFSTTLRCFCSGCFTSRTAWLAVGEVFSTAWLAVNEVVSGWLFVKSRAFGQCCSVSRGLLSSTACLSGQLLLLVQREEAIDLVAAAIKAGIFNDLGSGSNVDVCVITKVMLRCMRLHPCCNPWWTVGLLSGIVIGFEKSAGVYPQSAIVRILGARKPFGRESPSLLKITFFWEMFPKLFIDVPVTRRVR